MTTALGFLLGRVRSREGQLLALAELNRADFAAESFEEFENKLNQDFALLRQDLFQDSAVAKIFWRRYDYHNLKFLLKEKLTDQNFNRYILPYAKNKLADFDRSLVMRAEDIYAQTQDFCQMDYFIDQEYLRELQTLARKHDRHVQAYAQALSAVFEYKRNYNPETALETLRAKFPGLELPENPDEGAIEKALEDYANQQLFAGRYGCNATTVLCFLQAKENEIKNLKTMYLSRRRELDLQGFLRWSYA